MLVQRYSAVSPWSVQMVFLFLILILFTLCCKEQTLCNRCFSPGFMLSVIIFLHIFLSSSSAAMVLVLFSSCLAAGSLWKNLCTYCNCSNRRPCLVLSGNSSWIVLGLHTLSSHVLADCIPNSGPADWQCNWTPHCFMSIWVVLGLDSLSLCVIQCYTRNIYSAHWPCNRNPPLTTMFWLVMLCLLWHPSYFLELILSFTLCQKCKYFGCK